MCAMNTVKCLTLMKGEFFAQMLTNSSKLQQSRVKFFQVQFAELSKKKIDNFHPIFVMNTFSRGQTIYVEDTPADHFHIVKSGEVGLFKFGKTLPKLRSREIAIGITDKEKDEIQKYYEFGNKGIYGYKKPVLPTSESLLCLEKALPISTLGALSIIGGESLLGNPSAEANESTTYHLTSVSLQNDTTIFSLHKNQFEKAKDIIGRFAFNNLQNTAKVKSYHIAKQRIQR